MQKSKKGMQWLSAIAYAIIALVMIVGIGMTVLDKLADSTATCASGYTYTASLNKCVNATSEDPTDPTTVSWVAINYGNTQLGSSGLLSWLPAIIALVIGLFFLASFMGKKKEY
jgi:flagellar biosynthesis protein FliQ